MKKKLTLLVLSLLSISAFSQTNNRIIEGKNYKGVIFYEANKLRPQDTVSRWTPSDVEIEELENKLLSFMHKQSKKTIINQGGNCPIIPENLNKYIRQYAGYFSPKHEKMIYVNCFWYDEDDRFSKGWENKLFQPFDGCSYYWHIHYNLKRKKFFGYSINGSA